MENELSAEAAELMQMEDLEGHGRRKGGKTGGGGKGKRPMMF